MRSDPFDPDRDHYLGDIHAPHSLVFYGDYTSLACRRLRDILGRISDALAREVVFIYRQCPRPGVPGAQAAARAALAAGEQGQFWQMHDALYSRGQGFGPSDLMALADDLGLDRARFEADFASAGVSARLQADRRAAADDGIQTVPRLYINGAAYDGAWDEDAILEAIERPLGYRVREARLRFFNWAAAGGSVLLAATLLALAVVNFGFHEAYEALAKTEFALSFGAHRFGLPLEVWINDGLMALFFLLVGIEIKREIVSGDLSNPRAAMLPIVGAAGGMVVPVLIYLAFNPTGPGAEGWGVPMATDIAFTLGLMALLGRKVPSSLKVFVSALAIADDLGAVVVIALFYGHGFHIGPFLGALAAIAVMGLLARGRVYNLMPYLMLGLITWALVYASGLHATLAGVATAAMIPSRAPANVKGVAAQTGEVFRASLHNRGDHDDMPAASMAVLENLMGRLRNPGVYLHHALQNWTSFLILPLFAFFNTGVLITGTGFSLTDPVSLGVILGLAVGKPLGILASVWLAVRLGAARLSSEVTWHQMIGAGCLAGVGFTMSIFIATSAFSGPMLGAVKLSVLCGSLLSAVAGTLILYRAAPSHGTNA